MPFCTIPRQPGSTVHLTLNQAKREVRIIENHQGYDLGIYTMPAGRATLIRVTQRSADPFQAAGCKWDRPKLYANASKKERTRHAKVILAAQLDAAYDLEADADNARTRRAQHQRKQAAKRLIRETEAALAALEPVAAAQNAQAFREYQRQINDA